MTELRKAAEMALETLCVGANDAVPNDIDERFEQAIQALRQALAQPEQKTPLKVLNLTVFTENRLRNGRVYDVETLQAMTSRDILAIPDMGKKALKEVLEALDVYAVNISQERVDETAKGEHEPVAWRSWNDHYGYGFWETKQEAEPWCSPDFFAEPIYTASPKREWVGLTDEDVHDAFNYVEMVKLLDFDRDRPEWCEAFARACEATLRHRNGDKR